MKTIPFLDTVAGEALSMLWGSNMILQFGAIGILSPFASVKVLLSSSTLLWKSGVDYYDDYVPKRFKYFLETKCVFAKLWVNEK